MTDRPFLDTNVLVYAHVIRSGSAADPRTEIAGQLLVDGGTISVQVLNEFCDVLSRRFAIAWHAIGERVDAIASLCGRALPLTASIHEAARSISQRHGFRIYDSLILASAADAGCTLVYTEDMQHGQTIEGLRIVNPFV